MAETQTAMRDELRRQYAETETIRVRIKAFDRQEELYFMRSRERSVAISPKVRERPFLRGVLIHDVEAIRVRGMSTLVTAERPDFDGIRVVAMYRFREVQRELLNGRLAHEGIIPPSLLHRKLVRVEDEIIQENLVQLAQVRWICTPEVHFNDLISYIDTQLMQEPDPPDVIRSLIDTIDLKMRTGFTAKQLAYGRYLTTYLNASYAQGRKREIRLTPATMTHTQRMGHYVQRGFMKQVYTNCGMLSLGILLARTLAAMLKRKDKNEVIVTSRTAGVTDPVLMSDPVVLFHDWTYSAKRNGTLRDLVLRPHVAQYYIAKALGVPMMAQKVYNGGVYLDFHLTRSDDVLFGGNIPDPYKVLFMSRPVRKWKSKRDIGWE